MAATQIPAGAKEGGERELPGDAVPRRLTVTALHPAPSPSCGPSAIGLFSPLPSKSPVSGIIGLCELSLEAISFCRKGAGIAT